MMRKNNLSTLAFTMAEILLSLTIIGVVAAITLPSLTGNINERTWNTQRKVLYARMSQAISLMPALNGYGKISEDENGSITEDTATETFLTNGLAKVFKINNICDNEHLKDCGIGSKYTDIVGSSQIMPTQLGDLNSFMLSASYKDARDWGSFSFLNTKAAAFETQNGESILAFYNPFCRNTSTTLYPWAQTRMCANFIYDLNGNKGPNTVGKDIGFISVIYPTDSIVVAPMPYSKDSSSGIAQVLGSQKCSEMDSNARMPNIHELSAMFYNTKMLNMTAADYWSSSMADNNYRVEEYWDDNAKGLAWGVAFRNKGVLFPTSTNFNGYIRCIKR